jgi:hypothetical protein
MIYHRNSSIKQNYCQSRGNIGDGQSTIREYELLTKEIKWIIDDFDAVAEYAVFWHEHDSRQRRMNSKVEQSAYLLDVQRVDSDPNDQHQEKIKVPTLTNSLGENFWLQL